MQLPIQGIKISASCPVVRSPPPPKSCLHNAYRARAFQQAGWSYARRGARTCTRFPQAYVMLATDESCWKLVQLGGLMNATGERRFTFPANAFSTLASW